MRDDLRGYVIDAFAEPDAVLVVDETGDLKKGEQAVGVQRQYTGTAGRIENAQVAVFVTYAARRGHALIDRALYLPASRTDDRDRCAVAGVPEDVAFATKPALATAMITRAVRAGAGSKGPRYYAWAWIALLPEDAPDTGQHHLLIRRNPATGELAYLRCYSPGRVPLSTLVRAAGQRWRIEESFQAAKGLVGLDQHRVRRWRSWHRWTTLAMLAHAFLAVATATERDHAPTPLG